MTMWGRQYEAWQTGFAVRRDWPVDGTHEFVGWQATAEAAAVFEAGDRAFWAKGPIRPTWSVVAISRRDFALHARRHGCRAPDCPVGDEQHSATDPATNGAASCNIGDHNDPRRQSRA